MTVSDVVRATSGRDRGRCFFIVACLDDYVLLADGRHRRLEQPKRKKKKHVEKCSASTQAVAAKLVSGEKVTNNELWQALADYREG